MDLGYPDISELIYDHKLREEVLDELATDNQSLGSQKRSSSWERWNELDSPIEANKSYKILLKVYHQYLQHQKLKKVLVYSTITTQEIFLKDPSFLVVQSGQKIILQKMNSQKLHILFANLEHSQVKS